MAGVTDADSTSLATARLAAMRHEYALAGLAEDDLAPDWLTQFGRWLAEAEAAGVVEPNAMVLATADPAGRPSARTVLLKGVDARGFLFFTNYVSRKGTELAANRYASLVFPWHAVDRQVVVCGRAERIERAEVAAYFATRPRASQLGAWASEQSQVVSGRPALERAFAEVSERFQALEVPAPPEWGGLRVDPETVEFWQGRTGRMHDRLRFCRTEAGWVVQRLAP